MLVTRLVIRLDDIGRDLPTEVRFMVLSLRRGLRLSCGVVPTWLAGGNSHRLKDLAAAHPDSLEIHQHGYSHTDYRLTPTETKYEFGPARSFAEQLADIACGAAILDAAFGQLFVRVFSPPFGEYDDNTLSALTQTDMKAITGLRPDATLGGFPQYPGNIDLFQWGPPQEKPRRTVIREWRRLDPNLRVVVVHPGLMRVKSVEPIVSLLAGWNEQCPCCLFRDLIGEP